MTPTDPEDTLLTQARSALHADAFAPFTTQATTLRRLLTHLPPVAPGDPALSGYNLNQAHETDLDGVLAFLEQHWLVCNPPNSHEGAISLSLDDTAVPLQLIFTATVWGYSSEQGRHNIARTGPDAYLLWSTRPSSAPK